MKNWPTSFVCASLRSVYGQTWGECFPAPHPPGKPAFWGAKGRQCGTRMSGGKVLIWGSQGDLHCATAAGQLNLKFQEVQLNIFWSVLFFFPQEAFWTTYTGTCTNNFWYYYILDLVNSSLNNLLLAAVDQCLSSPCKNGATCTRHLETYVCKCAVGYHGQNCDRGRPQSWQTSKRFDICDKSNFWSLLS